MRTVLKKFLCTGHETDHSHPPTAEVKNSVELYIISLNTSSWYLIKQWCCIPVLRIWVRDPNVARWRRKQEVV